MLYTNYAQQLRERTRKSLLHVTYVGYIIYWLCNFVSKIFHCCIQLSLSNKHFISKFGYRRNDNFLIIIDNLVLFLEKIIFKCFILCERVY